jgi:transcriptional regulator with XRE-family HTH domain
MTEDTETYWHHANGEKKHPLHYTACGLDNIYLLSGYDIEVIDGEDFLTIRNLDGLHAAIGQYLVRSKKILTGKELRFLRRQMDMTQSEMARLFGCDAQQIARYEKDENKIPGPADRLLRAIFQDHAGGDQSILELLRTLDELDTRISDIQSFEATEDGWKAAA